MNKWVEMLYYHFLLNKFNLSNTKFFWWFDRVNELDEIRDYDIKPDDGFLDAILKKLNKR